MTIYNVNEMLSYYEETIAKLVKTSDSSKKNWNKIKRTCIAELKERFKDNQFAKLNDSPESGKFYNDIARIQRMYNPKYQTDTTKVEYIASQPQATFLEDASAPKGQNFMNAMRSAGNTGFIPYFEYIQEFLEPILSPRDHEDMRTKKDIKAYIVHLREQGYIITENSHGWICTPPAPKETPEEKERREIKEQLAVLMDRLNKIGK